MEGRASYCRAPGWSDCHHAFICKWTSPFQEKVTFHFNPKERQCQRLLKLPYSCAHFTHCKIMLKIPQARLQQYVNWALPDIQTGFRKGRGTRDQIANIHWIIEKAREFQENIYFPFINYMEAFDCVDHNKLWKILKEMGTPDHLTCLFLFCWFLDWENHSFWPWMVLLHPLCPQYDAKSSAFGPQKNVMHASCCVKEIRCKKALYWVVDYYHCLLGK